MSGAFGGVPNAFANAVTATGLQLDNNNATISAYINDPTNRINYATDSGNTATFAIALAPAATGYTQGLWITFKAANANAANPQVNVNSLGAKSLVDVNKVGLAANAIPAGGVVAGVYDGTSVVVISPLNVWNSLNVANTATATITGAVMLGSTVQLSNNDSNIVGGLASGRFGINGDPAGFGTGPSFIFRGSSGGASIDYYTGTVQASIFTSAGGLQIKASGLQLGSPTGGDKGAGTANFAADIYKNNTAYTNPDYVFEHYYTGKIVKYIGKEGARQYKGRKSLEQLRGYTKRYLHLPGFGQKAGLGGFSGGDMLLARLEEAYLHIFELHDRLKRLERK